MTDDIENFSFNTSIAAFMICLNELSQLKSKNRAVMEQFAILMAPFTPHLSEELYESLGHTTSVCDAQWPQFNEDYLKEDSVKMMISFNGKARFPMEFAADADNAAIEKAVMENPQTAKYMEGWTLLKVIIVPKKIVNIVLKK